MSDEIRAMFEGINTTLGNVRTDNRKLKPFTLAFERVDGSVVARYLKDGHWLFVNLTAFEKWFPAEHRQAAADWIVAREHFFALKKINHQLDLAMVNWDEMRKAFAAGYEHARQQHERETN